MQKEAPAPRYGSINSFGRPNLTVTAEIGVPEKRQWNVKGPRLTLAIRAQLGSKIEPRGDSTVPEGMSHQAKRQTATPDWQLAVSVHHHRNGRSIASRGTRTCANRRIAARSTQQSPQGRSNQRRRHHQSKPRTTQRLLHGDCFFSSFLCVVFWCVIAYMEERAGRHPSSRSQCAGRQRFPDTRSRSDGADKNGF